MFLQAFRYSIPVLMGYAASGAAFGLLLVDAGYPAWLAPVMGVVMYAGAGQYIAVGLFAAGTGLFEAFLVQIIVNARHLAYGFTMLERFRRMRLPMRPLRCSPRWRSGSTAKTRDVLCWR